MDSRRIAFIGLGNMGYPMALRLARSSRFEMRVFDADTSRVVAFCAETDAVAASSPGEAVAGCALVILMLPNGGVVEAVLRGDGAAEGGILADACGCLVVDMSSSHPDTYGKVADLADAAGATIIDAPVSGGVKGAVDGTLSIMAGGAWEHVAIARPVLEMLGSKVFETGATGTGQAMKALNNLLSAGTLVLTIETLAIGRRNGLDLEQMTEILNVSTGRNNSTDRKIRQFILSQAYNSGFGHSLMAKDVATALSLVGASSEMTPVAMHAGEVVAAAERFLGAGADHTEIAKAISAFEHGSV